MVDQKLRELEEKYLWGLEQLFLDTRDEAVRHHVLEARKLVRQLSPKLIDIQNSVTHTER